MLVEKAEINCKAYNRKQPKKEATAMKISWKECVIRDVGTVRL